MLFEPVLPAGVPSSKRNSEFISCSPSLSCRNESNGREEILYSIPLDPINPKSPLRQIQNLMRILFRVIRTSGGFGNQKESKNITEWKTIKRADHFLIFEDLFIRWLSDLSFHEFGKSSGERLAFLINLHNLLLIHNIIKKEGKKPKCPLTRVRYNIAGCQLNVNQLETGIRGLYTFTHNVASPCNLLFIKMGWPKECLIRDSRVFFTLSRCNEQSHSIDIMGVEDLAEKLEDCRFHFLNQIEFDEKKKKIILPIVMKEYYEEMKKRNGEDVDLRFLINKDLRLSNIKMNTMITGDIKLEYKSPSYYSVSVILGSESINENYSTESSDS
eukprot:TRINITY_DN5979_c0_g1_i1.p1 TRINITY_DN5979_c0_g1~~TRINITY_DN5979_c0_g1_i1.p1  ORF type:complete len:329 (+),score=105.20 TRINITY_DN5979_c0_g1_i1:159-1145(+)